MSRSPHHQAGFTLIEVLIVISIVAIMIIGLTFSLTRQRDKADNTRIKTDLSRLKIAFEDYYNDHNCYPPAAWFDGEEDCDSRNLQPYLGNIPCNRSTGRPYPLEKDATGCTWFKLYGYLKDPASDPQALAQYSDTGSTLGNYGVSSSNTIVSVLFTSAPTPTPNPTPPPSTPPGTYYCQSAGPGGGQPGNCSLIPGGQNCSPSYADPNCGDSNRCASTTSTCN